LKRRKRRKNINRLTSKKQLLADRTNGRAYATVLRLSRRCRLSSSVMLCIVAKCCVLEQKLLLTAYRKSYMRNRLVPKWMTLAIVFVITTSAILIPAQFNISPHYSFMVQNQITVSLYHCYLTRVVHTTL